MLTTPSVQPDILHPGENSYCSYLPRRRRCRILLLSSTLATTPARQPSAATQRGNLQLAHILADESCFEDRTGMGGHNGDRFRDCQIRVCGGWLPQPRMGERVFDC